MKLIGYVRVSSEGQAFDGNGLEIQHKAIRTWAKANGHTLIRIEEDAGISGEKDAAERPGLAAALQAVRDKEAAGVVVARLDRLARKLHVQEAALEVVWRASGSVFAADQGEVRRDDPDDPMRDAIRKMQGVFAELDRKLVVKRLRDGRRTKAGKGGKAVGAYAFGTRKGVGREPAVAKATAEQKIVRQILALRRGGLSYSAIAASLNGAGMRPRPRVARKSTEALARSSDSGLWSASSVRSVCLRAAKPLPARGRAEMAQEQRAVEARILELRKAGTPYRTIAQTLDLEGMKPRRAQAWSAMAVRAVCQRAGFVPSA
jgi:DNA invertase Pin-like site-specific DNA recombinase